MTRLATFDTPLHTTADAGVFTYEWATSNAGGTHWDRYDATHWDHADATHWDLRTIPSTDPVELRIGALAAA